MSVPADGARPSPEPTEHAESGGHPNPLPPDPLGVPVGLIPPPEPATPGGGIGQPYVSSGYHIREPRATCTVFHRLLHLGRSVTPSTYLLAGLLVATAFLVVPDSEVHTGLIEAPWRTTNLAVGTRAYTILRDLLEWSWHHICGVIALKAQLTR